MLNQVILVGKVTKIYPLLNNMQLSIESSEDIQFISVYLSDALVDQTKEYLKIGATVGIKARLESDFGINLLVVVDKITFIDSAT